jgi:hypothetical protein
LIHASPKAAAGFLNDETILESFILVNPLVARIFCCYQRDFPQSKYAWNPEREYIHATTPAQLGVSKQECQLLAEAVEELG